jgi:hypothetical protein
VSTTWKDTSIPQAGVSYPVEILTSIDSSGEVHFYCTADVSGNSSGPTGQGSSVEEAFNSLKSSMKENYNSNK